MANELTFKIIDIEDAIVDFKHGHISEDNYWAILRTY